MTASNSPRLLQGTPETLTRVRGYLLDHPELRDSLGPLDHFAFVIDSNYVLGEVGWLAIRRKKPGVRTQLQLLHAAGIVTIFAPEHLQDEVESHFAKIANHYGTTVDVLRAVWIEYASIIHFVPAAHLGPPDRKACDPKDVPFVQTKDAVGAVATLSKDHHLAVMGSLLIANETLRQTLDFAMHASDAVQGRALGAGVLMTGSGLVYGVSAAIAATIRGYRRLPGWLKVAIPIALGVAAVAVTLHPKVRGKARQVADEVKRHWPEFRGRAGKAIGQYLDEFASAENSARSALEIVRRQIPKPRHGPTLRQLAYRVCLAADSPIHPTLLEARIRYDGYATRAKDLLSYLNRVLRADPRFRRVNGAWDLAVRVSAPATGYS